MLEIRRYQPQDNEAVKRLHHAGRAQMGLPASSPGEPALIDTDLDDIEGVYLNGGDFIVGLADGEIVAMGGFKKRTPECAEFKRLRIRQDCQRKGYGETITLKLIELAAQMGYTEAFLDTLTTNIGSQRLAERCGFVKSGGARRGPFDLLFYTRKLTKGGT